MNKYTDLSHFGNTWITEIITFSERTIDGDASVIRTIDGDIFF